MPAQTMRRSLEEALVADNFTIEMTVRGVLMAGKWRTEEELNHIPTNDKRNTLIVELTKHTNQPAGYFQGFDDHALVGKAATAVLLQEASILNVDELQKLSDDDQRNMLIVQNNNHLDTPVGELQGKNNYELVQLGLQWYAKAKTISAILEFSFSTKDAQVLETVPEVLETMDFDNSESDIPLHSKFTVKKDVTSKSSFSRQHGFSVKLGVSTKFTAGIPRIAENMTTVSLEASTSHTWNFGEENTITQSYTHESPVEVPPGKMLRKMASITRATMDVPYTAKIRAEDGSIKTIKGTWNGVSTLKLIEKQILVNKAGA
jgi:hypothetical protein